MDDSTPGFTEFGATCVNGDEFSESEHVERSMFTTQQFVDILNLINRNIRQIRSDVTVVVKESFEMTIGYTFLVYADRVNYDWIAAAPGRKLILDSDFRTDTIPGEVLHWNGSGPFPEGAKNGCVVVPVPDADALTRVVGAIRGGKLPVQTVALTSVSMLQQNEFEKSYNGAPDSQQAWGKVLKAFSSPMKALLQTAKDQSKPLECVILTAGAREFTAGDALSVRPFIEGQLEQRIRYLCDVIGFMSQKKAGQKKENQLQIEPTASVYARSNYSALDKYAGFVQSPSISILINEMRNSAKG